MNHIEYNSKFSSLQLGPSDFLLLKPFILNSLYIENMFPALEKELSENPFFQAWKKKSIFEQLIGTSPLLLEEFSEGWVRKLKGIVGDGPLTSRFLANLAEYIEYVRQLKGYDNIKNKLGRLDDRLYPTLAEIQFVHFLLQRTPSKNIHLEHTFKTRSGKNPELKVDCNSDVVYFEVTSVQDFKERSLILWFFNILAAFQMSLKTLQSLRREIIIRCLKYPTEKVLWEIYKILNTHMDKRMKNTSYPLLFNEEYNDYRISFSEGDDVVFDMPMDIIEKKIKDKIDEETRQFDEGEHNFIVVDITPIVVNVKHIADMVREYFKYSGNKIVWGVLLFSNKWSFRGFEPIYQTMWVHQASPLVDVKEALDIVSSLLPRNSV